MDQRAGVRPGGALPLGRADRNAQGVCSGATKLGGALDAQSSEGSPTLLAAARGGLVAPGPHSSWTRGPGGRPVPLGARPWIPASELPAWALAG